MTSAASAWPINPLISASALSTPARCRHADPTTQTRAGSVSALSLLAMGRRPPR
ncbi:hypothetical protein I549_4327 [Mycobacterium avium subsp. avium 2285 (R)]|nr:hypothetical protein I549_4327 [Mycobacterium avium subsp. avium 2285 (R)]